MLVIEKIKNISFPSLEGQTYAQIKIQPSQLKRLEVSPTHLSIKDIHIISGIFGSSLVTLVRELAHMYHETQNIILQ